MPKRAGGRKGRGDGRKSRGGDGRKAGAKGDARKSDTREDAQDEAPAARSFWSGTISFGLVSVPVDLFSMNRSAGVSLRMLAPDGTPLRRRYFCPEEDQPIEREDIVRGYRASGKNADEEGYVVVEDDELEALEPEKSRDIDLRRFVDASEIDPAYFERGYLLAPSGDSNKAYRLLAAIMERTGRAGIATFVLRKKEYLVAIFAENGILRAETLRFRDELRTPKMVGLPEGQKADAKRVKRLKAQIADLESSDLPEDELEDDYTRRVLALVHQKLKKGEDVVHPDAEALEEVEEDEEEEEGGKVIDLMEVLRKRLEQSSAGEGGGRARAAGGGHGKARSTGREREKARSTGRGRASADGARPDTAALRKMTKDELYERAQELDISGRSGMTKGELIEAIGKT